MYVMFRFKNSSKIYGSFKLTRALFTERHFILNCLTLKLSFSNVISRGTTALCLLVKCSGSTSLRAQKQMLKPEKWNQSYSHGFICRHTRSYIHEYWPEKRAEQDSPLNQNKYVFCIQIFMKMQSAVYSIALPLQHVSMHAGNQSIGRQICLIWNVKKLLFAYFVINILNSESFGM